MNSLSQYLANGTGGSGKEREPDVVRTAPSNTASVKPPNFNFFDSFGAYLNEGVDAVGTGTKQAGGDTAEPGFWESVLRVGAATAFAKSADLQTLVEAPQRIALKTTQAALSRFGVNSEAAIPTVAAIHESTQKVIDWHSQVLPLQSKKMLSKRERAQAVHEKAEQLTRMLFEHQLGIGQPPSEEEKTLASAIAMYAEQAGPEELRKILGNVVFLRAQDVASMQQDAELAHLYAPALTAINSSKEIEPDRYFVTDVFTRRVMYTGPEAKKLDDMFWGVSPNALWIRRASKQGDVVKIPWTDIRTNGKNEGQWMMIGDSPQYVDVLRRNAGWLFRGLSEEAAKRVGGSVQLQATGREGLVLPLVVRRPKEVQAELMRVVSHVRSAQETLRLMEEQAHEQNPALKSLIRPAVVTHLLPDPTVLKARIVLGSGGKRDYLAEAWAIHRESVDPAERERDEYAKQQMDIHGNNFADWPDAQRERLELLNHKAFQAKQDAMEIMKVRKQLLQAV
ncbi:hypothetical protein HY948_02200 [Candidatus Gottesmanbacteria bacterium]|nr:hypothetical protein [Candidatus Gottesmanbacteria bacterium]